ncbi:hypothetical protein ACFQU2_09325 [Siccirubricoccus deserti]
MYVIEDVQTSYWPSEHGGPSWGGRHVHDPAFAGTCVGEFVELAKYLNYSEFLSHDELDLRRLALARNITRISFEHNLIFVWKGRNEGASNAHRYARPALQVAEAAEPGPEAGPICIGAAGWSGPRP